MNTTKRGDRFEEKVFALLDTELRQGRLWLNESRTRIYRKRKYYSKDREAAITIDIALETFLPGATEPSLFTLVECKDLGRAVAVDDVEEFHSKIQQITGANAKGILASSGALQLGALRFAKSKGIAVLRILTGRDVRWELRRESTCSARRATDDIATGVEKVLIAESPRSRAHSLFAAPPNGLATNSLWDLVASVHSNDESGEWTTNRLRPSGIVPFESEARIEGLADAVRKRYRQGEEYVEPLAICEELSRESDFRLIKRDPGADERGLLGGISFVPLEITLINHTDNRRERFTVSHELGHLFLKHDRFLQREMLEAEDAEEISGGAYLPDDVSRLEHQANGFASALLMPRRAFVRRCIASFHANAMRGMRGGTLYVDNQPCNLELYHSVTDPLVKHFGVSRSALTIRMKRLGLLRDQRHRSEPTLVRRLISLPALRG